MEKIAIHCGLLAGHLMWRRSTTVRIPSDMENTIMKECFSSTITRIIGCIMSNSKEYERNGSEKQIVAFVAIQTNARGILDHFGLV